MVLQAQKKEVLLDYCITDVLNLETPEQDAFLFSHYPFIRSH